MDLTNSRRFAAIALVAGLALIAGPRGPAAANADPPTGICESGIVSCATLAISISSLDTGSAHIVSEPAGVDCTVTAGVQRGACSAEVRWSTLNPPDELVLTMTPGPGTQICRVGCAGVNQPFTVSFEFPEAGHTYTALNVHFEQVTQVLDVSLGGTGGGTVTSEPAAIACGTVCSATLLRGTLVSLVAIAAPGSSFRGWTGSCAGEDAICPLTLSRDRTTTAIFDVPAPPASVPPVQQFPPANPVQVSVPPKFEFRIFTKLTLPSRVAHVTPSGSAIWLRVASSQTAELRVVVPNVNYYDANSHRHHFALEPVRLGPTTAGTIVLNVPPAQRQELLAARRADLLGLKITGTIPSTGAATPFSRGRVQVDLRPPEPIPRGFAQPKAAAQLAPSAGSDFQGVTVIGEDDQILATFRSAKCSKGKVKDKKGRSGFFVDAISGQYELTAHIDRARFAGFKRTYELIFGPESDGYLLFNKVGETTGGVYSNSFVPPFAAPGYGAIAFSPNGKRVSIGFGPVMWTQDFSTGVVLAGALECRYPKKGRK